jgi:1-acyl-sn-glycerol-3-phosphate acyltransferase
MIPVNRRRWFEHWFAGHVRRRFARRFSAVRVRGFSTWEATAARGPMLVVANHTAWWDSMVLFDLSFRTLRLRGNVMMDARNLRAIPLLGWIGAFGVELGDKEDGRRAVEYARSLLVSPGDWVGVFAQGRERPVCARPLGFLPGIARIAMAAPSVPIVPIALRYEHGKREKPEALVDIGAAFTIDPAADEATVLAAVEAAVLERMESTERALVAGETSRWPVRIDGGLNPSWLARLFGAKPTV